MGSIVARTALLDSKFEKIEKLDPDALTLDYEMPDLDGIQVLRHMHRRGVRAKAIMVSSYTAEGARVTTDALLRAPSTLC